MFAPLFFVAPLTYLALRNAAALRHRLVLGTDRDLLMRLIYPL